MALLVPEPRDILPAGRPSVNPQESRSVLSAQAGSRDKDVNHALRQNGGLRAKKKAMLAANSRNRCGRSMTKPTEPIIIKKYANRRLYNTGTSTYVTLEDLASMVKKGKDFVGLRRQDRRGHHPLGAHPDHLRAGEQGRAEPSADHLPAPADPLLRRQHADAGAALSRSLDRLADARAGEIPRTDGAGLRRRRLRPDGRAGAPQHGDVRAHLRRCSRRSRGAKARRRPVEPTESRGRARAAARSTISSGRWKRCRSGSIA